jgi:outer membrane murein-binding lipoprotein Lpp
MKTIKYTVTAAVAATLLAGCATPGPSARFWTPRHKP